MQDKAVTRNKTPEDLFYNVGVVAVPPVSGSIVLSKSFIWEMGISIHHIEDFSVGEWFLDGREVELREERALKYVSLSSYSSDEQVLAALGGERQVETAFIEVLALLILQPSGEKGTLLTNGLANLFYIRDKDDVLRALRILWFGYYNGWSIRARSTRGLIKCRTGNQVFSRMPATQ